MGAKLQFTLVLFRGFRRPCPGAGPAESATRNDGLGRKAVAQIVDGAWVAAMADPHPHSPPIVLTVAGSECRVRWLQADLKTFAAFGAYGLSAVTCVVSEVPGKVEAVHPVPAELVESQIRLLLASLPVAAVRRMLFSAQVVRRGGRRPQAPSSSQNRPLIVDPVMIATSGDPLIEPDAIAAYEECLFPVAEIITPNLDEAAHLLGWRAREEHDLGHRPSS